VNIQVHRAEYKEVEAMRGLYRQEANCQIIGDSLLSRGLADPYVILVEGRMAGYGGVRNRHDIGRLMEFYTLPHVRSSALPMFRELLAVSQATSIEAQTNMPLMLTMLYDCATDITEQSILFQDAFTTSLACPDGVFRRSTPEDAASIFPHHQEPVGDWIVEAKGAVVATGGFLCHYNPPYGDIFMEVSEPARRQGFGSYLVQEVKRVCYEAGKKPAARCNPANVASRRTLQKAGFLPCGRLLAGRVGRPA
jgi:GNAT superfamily N-acetyltransferase